MSANTIPLTIRTENAYATGAVFTHVLAEQPEHLRGAVVAWLRTGIAEIDEDTGLPELEPFDDAYCGEYDSWSDYVECFIDDTGMLAEVPENLQAYFDAEKFGRDLKFDYVTEPAVGGGVHVFRNQ